MSVETQFLNSMKPVLPSGSTLQIVPGQTLTVPGLAQTGAGAVKLAVTGPQTSLDDVEVQSVYPAPGSRDSPAEFLPHVVLSRRTMPWERRGPNGGPVWLALLLFRKSELVTGGAQPSIVSTTSAGMASRDALSASRIATVLQNKGATFQVLYLDRGLFRSICPTAAELPMLCNVKRTVSDGATEDRAVVIGSRLPTVTAGSLEEHTAFLVSLEGRDDAYTPVAGQIGLVILKQWSFTPTSGGDFEQVIRAIHVRPNGGVMRFGNLPHVPAAGETAGLTPGFASLLDDHAFFLDPLEHSQVGDVSYRSPLRPFAPPPRSSGFAVQAAPEELSGQTSAMPLDYSHAAAFELGRLLALSSQDTLEDLQAITTKIDIRPPNEVVNLNLLPLILQKKDWVVNPGPDTFSDPWTFASDPGQAQRSVFKSQVELQSFGIADISGVAAQVKTLGTQVQNTLAANQLQSTLEVSQINVQQITTPQLDTMFATLSEKVHG